MSIFDDYEAALDPARLFEVAFGLSVLDWQRDYLRETRNAVLLKGRQIGASLAAAALACHVAIFTAEANAIIVSPSQPQSSEITKKARAGLRRLGVRLVQDSATVLRLGNGSRVISLPGTAKSVRGWTARLLVLDEAAYIAPDTWVAAQAIVATGGRVVAQSTPATDFGDFHDLATSDDPAWSRFHVRSDEVPTVSAEFLAGQRRSLSPDAFATEFECAFGRSGAGLFSLDQVNSMFVEAIA